MYRSPSFRLSTLGGSSRRHGGRMRRGRLAQSADEREPGRRPER